MIYNVIVDISADPIDRPFYYKSNLNLNIGDRVLVPFGNRKIEGFVLSKEENLPEVSYEIKEVISKLDDFSCMSHEFIELANYMNKKNIRYIDSFRLFMPTGVRKGTARAKKVNYLLFNPTHTLDSALAFVLERASLQRDIIRKMHDEIEALESDINKEFSPAAVKALLEKRILIRETRIENRVPIAMKREAKEVTLTDDQKYVVKQILGSKKDQFLIHGVTGSGKTQVYISLIEHYLNKGKTAIILVPEISLTPQMLGIFRAKFGDKVGMLHSKLNPGERHDEWQRIRKGESTVVLGPRSAIFAPIKNVGIIIIDEEHDQSYISESNPRYFTIDIAKFRARYNGAKLVLGSATPSVETYKLAEEDGEYVLLEMPKRINESELPEIEIVDMRIERKQGNTTLLSKPLIAAMLDTLKKKEQTILFLNRRGYSSYISCQDCGYIAKCPSCDVSLTYHKYPELLSCHYCGAQYKTIKKCPMCGKNNLKDGRIGTEQVVDMIKKVFPEARVLRLDNDTTTKKDSYSKILSAFNRKEADILVGTQMVVKGHDFPDVTLVGILDADISLYVSNYKANEKTFQLITQVAGRAGREQKKGKVYLQTLNPAHPLYAVACSYDYKKFYYREKNIRKQAYFPPYSRIIKIMCTSEKEHTAVSKSRIIFKQVNDALDGKPGVIRIKHMHSSIKKLKNRYQYQVMIFVFEEQADEYMQTIYEIVNNNSTGDASVFIEVNPQD